MKKNLLNYFIAFFAIYITHLISILSPEIADFFSNSSESGLLGVFFIIAFLLILSFVVFYISHIIKIPSFVFAIFFGIAARPMLMHVTEEREILGAIVGLGATLILFGGGIETPFANFKRLILKILSLSFVGLFFTAFAFSWVVYGISILFGNPISIVTAVLLGAVLASTDPAAIIPVLKRLRFYHKSVKDIIVSESAVTDVTGTLLTVVFLSFILARLKLTSINEWYGAIFSYESAIVLFKQLFFGVFLGVIGYLLLETLVKFKKKYEQEFEVDSAFFLFVPLIIFTMALPLGGSGYLSAFIAGLMFSLSEHLYETERFFNHVIDGYFKPIIFILLGALIEPASLLVYAPIGIACAFIFMLIIRPIAVYVSLFIFHYTKKMSWRDMAFISFVRETGAIPAVLMVTITSLAIPDTQGLVEIGMWVILMTLIVEPLLTPFVAKFLKVAEPIHDTRAMNLNGEPVAVLVTRGKSFVDRLPFASEWAVKHGVKKMVILLCLENKYTLSLSRQIENLAHDEFEKINEDLIRKNFSEIEFSFISRKGLLHDNIENISKDHKNVSVIFAGQSMLDYHLNEIKRLAVPFYFIK